MDLFYADECGFSPSQPVGFSWSSKGQRKEVAYESPQGRRVNALCAYAPYGPHRGLRYRLWSRTLKDRDVLGFLKRLPSGERPCVVVLDNANIHKSRWMQANHRALKRLGLKLYFLPPYSPELNQVEPVFGVVKQYEMPERTYQTVPALMRAIRHGFDRFRQRLRKK